MGPLCETPLVMGHFAMNHVSFDVRRRASAAAGFVGMSVEFNEMQALFGTIGEAGVRDLLAGDGLQADHVELVRLLGLSGAERQDRDKAYCRLATALGTRGLLAVALDPNAPISEVVTTYGELARRAADHGLLCGLEFIPHLSAVPTLADAVTVIEKVDRPNALLVLDSLHFFRSGAPWELLENLPANSVMAVQVSDGPLIASTDDYYWEACSARLLPGEGGFDLARFMAAAHRARTPGPVTMEVMSDALDARDPVWAAQATLDAARGIEVG